MKVSDRDRNVKVTRAHLSQSKPTVALLPDAQTPLSQNTHSHIRNSQITNPPAVIYGVRLSLLSTVKTSLRISHLLDNLKTANQK